jgi:glycosyltransferase involved in cell wall biosynthesis
MRSGGAEERLGAVLRALSDNHDIHLLCSRSPADNERTLDGVTVHRPFLTQNVFAAHIVLTVLLPLYAVLLQPEVVYEDISAAPWFAPLTCFWLPHVAIVHNFNGEQLRSRGKHFKGALMALLDKMMLLFYKSRRVITVSQHVKDKLVDNGFTETEIVYNGVSADLLERDAEDEKNVRAGAGVSLLFVGRLEYRKGPDLLFNAWETLSEDFELHIVGRNEQGYRIPESALYHGYVSEKEKRRLFRESDLLLVPSRWEGYGIVVLEAAATNTKVLGNDVPGLRQAIEDVSGELVDFSDPAAVAEKIDEMTGREDDLVREEMMIRSWEGVAEETERILEDEIRKK